MGSRYGRAIPAALVIGTFVVAGLGSFAVTQALSAPQGQEERRGPGFGMRRGGPEMMGMMDLRQLDLSEGQRQAIRAMVEQHRSQIEPIARQMRETRQALREATTATPIDEALIRQRTEELAATQAEMVVLGARLRQEIHGLLTAEQLTKLEELQQQRRERMEQRRERFEQRRQQRQPGGEMRPQMYELPRSPLAAPARAFA